jgi:RNA-directed DNA polymerase
LNENLLERIVDPQNLEVAWKQVRKNKGKPGIDRVTIETYADNFRDNLTTIRSSLLEGNYTPTPVRRVEIEKPNGGIRCLGIPTVHDRVIQQAIAQVLNDIFDPEFSAHSFGFRKSRSAHDAVKLIRSYIQEGYKIAVDIDLAQFFDRVNHDILMVRVAKKVHDKRVLKLIGKYLRAGVQVGNTIEPTREGVPQGGPLSPLLANILLDDFDKGLEARGHYFARYADDTMILVRSTSSGYRVMSTMTRFLEKRLKLQINESKSRVSKAKEVCFLGFEFRGKKIVWSDKSFANFKHKVRKLTGRSWGVSMVYRLSKLREYFQGWMGYYRLSEYYKPIPLIDEWIRRRIRMCFIKQWRKPRTRIRNLIKLGVPVKMSIDIGLSRKGYHRLSRTKATQMGMTNQWLKEQGLLSIKDLWVAFHYK